MSKPLLTASSIVIIIFVLATAEAAHFDVAQFATSTSPPPSGQSESWPMFHYNVERTGSLASTAPITNITLWNYTTNSGVVSSPAIAEGKIFIASMDNNVYCLEMNSGSLIWNYSAGNWLQSSPAVADGKVFISSENLNEELKIDDCVYCLNETTGSKIWNYTTTDTSNNFSPIISSPAVLDGRVFVGSLDNNVYCLDENTGSKLWNCATASPIYSSPAVVNGKVFIGSFDGNIYCLDEATGNKIWNYETGSAIYSSPALDSEKVFAGSIDGYFYCLDEFTGNKIWSYKTSGSVQSSPAVAHGRVFIGDENEHFSYSSDNITMIGYLSGDVYCLEEKTGDKIWNYTTGPIHSSPAIADGKLYIGSNDGSLYCLSAMSGLKIWSFQTGYTTDVGETRNGVYFGGTSFHSGGVSSSPAIANGTVVVGSEDGRIYAFRSYSTVNVSVSTIIALGSTIIQIVWASYWIYLIGFTVAIASLTLTGVLLDIKRNTPKNAWTNNVLATRQALSRTMKWAISSAFSFFAALVLSNFLSTTGIKWKIGITSLVSVDLFGAIIPVATACLFAFVCLAHLKFSVKKYFAFLLFSIVLAMSLTQVVRDSLVSASVISPILLICAINGFVSFFFVFSNSSHQTEGSSWFLNRFQYTKRQLVQALLTTSSCAAFSALFVDVIIARYLGAYANIVISSQYIGGAGTADGILSYLIIAPMFTAAITAGMFAVFVLINPVKAKEPTRDLSPQSNDSQAP